MDIPYVIVNLYLMFLPLLFFFKQNHPVIIFKESQANFINLLYTN